MLDDGSTFEVRLLGGFRLFWSTITPAVSGHLRSITVPEFCHSAGLFGRCGEGTPGTWDIWPINNLARPNPLEEADRLCRPVKIAHRTSGVALISFQQDDHEPGALWLELFLSTTEPGPSGCSVFEEWVGILRNAKDDIEKEVVLRLTLGNITPEEIAGFKSQKKLVTTNLTLEIRPRTFHP